MQAEIQVQFTMYPQADVDKLTPKAEAGDLKAQEMLGRIHYDDLGVRQDYKKAVYWFEKAALQGSVFAQNYLGACYAQGCGVKQDFVQAYKWFNKAAKQGDVVGMQNLLLLCAKVATYPPSRIRDFYKNVFRPVDSIPTTPPPTPQS